MIRIGKIEFNMPPEYKQMSSLPGDPEDSVALGMESHGGAQCFVMLNPIDYGQELPLTSPEVIERVVTANLTAEQMLLSVHTGETQIGCAFACTIVQQNMPQGMLFILTLQIAYKEKVLNVHGEFMGSDDAFALAAKLEEDILNIN